MFSKLVKYNIVGVYYLSRVEGEVEFLIPNFHSSAPHYDIDYHALQDVIVCLVNLKSNHVPKNGTFVISLFITVEGQYSSSYFDEEWEEQYSPTNYSIRMLSNEESEWVDDQLKEEE